ncbi:MAG: alpha/beta hydrolase [Gammaproteobacteria bacterium]|nr:alpha/beta hydrolase [Gammaproteobacteria bacterium]
MPRFRHADLDIHYEQWGARANPPLLLLHGLSCQIIHWPQGLIDHLTEAGYRVIAMDNRDMGLSSRVSAPAPKVADILAAMDDLSRYPPSYTLSDMAADAVALLNHLGQAGAHIIGLSMGGMIAQTLAIGHPERTFSLTSIMSTTGNPNLPPGEPEALAAFIIDRPEDRDEAIAQYQRGWDTVAGPHFNSLTEGLARFSEQAVDRGFSGEGFARQLLAILHQPDRRRALAKVTAPGLVIHGGADPLVPLAAGEDTAKALSNGQLKVFDKMGHDLPEPLLAEIAAAIIDHINAAPSTR